MLKKIMYILYDVVLTRIVIAMGILLVVILIMQVGSRTFMSTPFTWTVEISRVLFVWFALLGSVVTLRRNEHIGVNIIYDRMNPKIQKILDFIVPILIIFTGAIMVIYGIELMEIGSFHTSPIVGIPMNLFYAAIFLTGILYIINCVYMLTVISKKNE